MPKGDATCPLGFHPQFRRPNYCKRCFREYGEHKSAKESSSTSINSLSFDRKDDPYGSRDSLVSTSRLKPESEGISRSRSDLSSNSLLRSNSVDDEKGSWGKARPMSWSAQDLRKAVDEAKETFRTSREDLSIPPTPTITQKHYGSSRSLTQDLGVLAHNRDNYLDSSYENETSKASSTDLPKTPSFSNYLAMRTKSPARPPLSKATSLQGVSSTNSSSHLEDDEYSHSKTKYSKIDSNNIGESKSYGTTTKSLLDGRPPKSPSRMEKVSKLPELPEISESRSEKSKRIIQSLREVKSEDADATYVIQLTPRKKEPKEANLAPKKVEIDLHSEVERLQKDIKELNKQNSHLSSANEQLQRENNELLAKKPRFGDLRKQTEATKLQSKIDELNEDIKKKNKEIKDAKKELEKRPLPKDVEKTMEDLRSKLQAAEQLCEELMDENEDYKKEVRTLEDEIEEMQDNFREEQADEYRDLKRELEQRAKDCRVLQFKLKKAERRSEQTERDKSEVEEKLKELQVAESDIERAEKSKTLEKELNLAKDVSMKMHEEMEKMKAQLQIAETDKKKLKERVQDAPLKPGSKVSRQQMMGRQGSQDNSDQIERDLHDALEREQDIREQLRFAEEETKNFRKKLSRVEEENESLQLQLNKMSTKAKMNRQKSLERTGSLERAGSVERGTLSRQGSTEKPSPLVNGEEVDPTELKIQLELNEQEAAVLRRKVEDLESENLRLQREFREILSSSDLKKLDYSNVPDVSKDNIYFTNKIKILEQECNELRKKIIEYSREKDQLRLEIESSKKKERLTKSSSQEEEEEEEEKKKKQEQEMNVAKNKLIQLEEQNEKLLDENKKLYLKSQLRRIPISTQENLSIEKQVLEDKVKRLEKKLKEALVKSADQSDSTVKNSSENNQRVLDLQSLVDSLQMQCDALVKENEDMKRTSGYKDRTPKVPKDITPKSTLIKWVAELEKECAILHSALKVAEGKRGPSEESNNLREIEDKLIRARERNEELTRQLKEEREKNEDKMKQKRVISGREDDTRRYEERIKDLEKEIQEEKEKFEQMKKRTSGGSFADFEELRSAQTAKHKLQKELAARQQSISVLERKLKESEETLKISEKSERNLRTLLEKAEFRLEEEKNSQSSLEGRQKDMTMSWLKERDDLKKEVASVRKAKDSLEKEGRQSDRIIKSLEAQLQTERKMIEEQEGKVKLEKDDLRKLKKENDNLQIELDELRDSLNRVEKEKKKNSTKDKDVEQLLKEKDAFEMRMHSLESELKTEKTKRGRLENDIARGIKGKTSEIEDYRNKIQSMESVIASITSEMENSSREYEDKIKVLERKLNKGKNDFESLQGKYDLLEEENVLQKAHRSINAGDDSSMRKDYETLKDELRTLRDTYNTHRDNWIREKLDMQIQLKEVDERFKTNGDNGLYAEKLRLRNIIDDKNQQCETLKSESETLKDQLAYYRREAEDLRRKTEDLEKLQDLAEKRQNSSSVDTKGFESTIRDLRTRLTALEKTNKSEITKMKMRYDTKIKALNEELATVTQHMSKYRRERDTYKEMLDGAQRTIADLKGGTAAPYRLSKADNATEAKAHLTEIHDLQSAMTELEDKLADSRLEVTKLKNEIVDHKTNYEIHLSDMQTKLNEYEEDRLLGGGGRRVPGLRTRLELNWQKEREEQQRLIHETATLAKDLRQTLYEVERERDMQRLEGKRKIDQLKRTVTQDHHDTKSKVQELQRDLLELREAHAKLRQINEKLRREKDRTEVEREAMRDKFLGSSREHLNQQARMDRMFDEIKKVKDLSPLVLGESIDGRETADAKLPSEPKPRTKEEFMEALRKLNKTSEELRSMMCLGDDRDRLRRTPSFRRALSTESDDEGRSHSVGRRGRPVPRGAKSQLYRKSQSLDHQLAEDRGKIWVSTDAGSTSSIESAATDDMRKAKYDLDRSLDRISTGSQTSDLDATGDEKKKKGIKGVFSKFGKAKSIEDTTTGGSIVGAGLQALAPGMTGSGTSLTSETEKESSVKGKLKTLFSTKKSPVLLRTNSLEKDGPSVKNLSTKFEEDTSTATSTTSINSLSNENAPLPVRRLHSGKLISSQNMSKARAFSTLGRTPSQETDV